MCSLLYLRAAQQGGARKDSTIVTSIGKIDHGIHDLGQEADGDNLAGRVSPRRAGGRLPT